MPLLRQQYISRTDLKKNRHVLYVYGDNTQRKGLGGQAEQMRGEPNGIGVATKYRGAKDPDAYFGEEPEQIIAQKRVIDEDMKPLFDKVKRGGVVVISLAGLGTDRADLEFRAPSTWDYLQEKLVALERTAEMFDKEQKL